MISLGLLLLLGELLFVPSSPPGNDHDLVRTDSTTTSSLTIEPGYRFEIFPSSDQPTWQTFLFGIGSENSLIPVSFQYRRATRFNQWDDLFTLHLYPNLWKGAYAYLRLQEGIDADVYANRDYSVELHQGVGNGWIPFLTYQFRQYPTLNAHLLGIGTDKYIGFWFLRAQAQLVSLGLREPFTALYGLQVRRQFSNETYLDGRIGYGREPTITGPGPSFGRGESFFLTAGMQYSFAPSLGLLLMGTLSKSAQLPLRTGLLSRLIYRL